MDFTLDRIGLTSRQSTCDRRRGNVVKKHAATYKFSARNRSSETHGNPVEIYGKTPTHRQNPINLPLPNITSFDELSLGRARTEFDQSHNSNERAGHTDPLRLDLDEMFDNELALRKMPRRKPRTQRRMPFDFTKYVEMTTGIPAAQSYPPTTEPYRNVLKTLELRGKKDWQHIRSKKEQPKIFLPAMTTNGKKLVAGEMNFLKRGIKPPDAMLSTQFLHTLQMDMLISENLHLNDCNDHVNNLGESVEAEAYQPNSFNLARTRYHRFRRNRLSKMLRYLGQKPSTT